MATVEHERLEGEIAPRLPRGAQAHPRRHLPAWLPHAIVPALAVLYIAFWALTSLQNMNETDLDAFFLPSARIALAGHPLFIYQTRFDSIYPNANGPLSFVPLTLVAAAAARLGWLTDVHLRRMLVNAVFAIFPLLMGREALLALDRLRGERLAGVWRWLALGCFVLTPELWHSVLLYGHIEQPLMIWLVLLGLRLLAEERPASAGAVLGLALLTRSVAGLYLLALVLALVLRGRWATALRTAVVAGLVALAGLLPFVLADRADTLYSLVTFRGGLPIGGGNVWLAAVGTTWEPLAQHDDGYIVIAAVVLVTALTCGLRRALTVRSRDVYALLGMAALCFPLFMKTLWPYYYLDASIFLTVWWLAAAPRAASLGERWRWLGGSVVPLGVIGVAELSELVYSTLVKEIWTEAWSLAIFALTLAILLAVGLWVLLRDSERGARLARGLRDGEQTGVPASAAGSVLGDV
ncbi:MAG: hypothetical protein ACHQ4H_09330 [Ktedonobacterales bacterium]